MFKVLEDVCKQCDVLSVIRSKFSCDFNADSEY